MNVFVRHDVIVIVLPHSYRVDINICIFEHSEMRRYDGMTIISDYDS